MSGNLRQIDCRTSQHVRNEWICGRKIRSLHSRKGHPGTKYWITASLFLRKKLVPPPDLGRDQVVPLNDLREVRRRHLGNIKRRHHVFRGPLQKTALHLRRPLFKLRGKGFPLLSQLDVLLSNLLIESLQVFPRTFEDPVERVIIRSGDRIKLVIVTAGAGHRQGKHPPGHHIDAVVNDIGLHPEKPAAQGKKAHRGEVTALAMPLREQKIGSELPLDELIVGQVPVEGFHYPVAINPGVGEIELLPRIGIPLGVGIPCHIEPETGPSFAIVRRGEQLIHHLGRQGLVVLGGSDEFIKSFVTGRKTAQIVVEPAQPIATRGWRRTPQACLSGSLPHKPGNRIGRGMFRHLHPHNRSQGPVVLGRCDKRQEDPHDSKMKGAPHVDWQEWAALRVTPAKTAVPPLAPKSSPAMTRTSASSGSC